MTNLYTIYITVTDPSLGQSGYLGSNSDFDVTPPTFTYVLRPDDESQIIAFFSKSQAEALRKRCIALIKQNWPTKASGVIFDIQEKSFSDKKAQQLLTGTYPDDDF